jgi:hypothetical protein
MSDDIHIPATLALGKSAPSTHSYKRLDGLQSRPGRYGDKSLLSAFESLPRGSTSRILVAVSTELHQLLRHGFCSFRYWGGGRSVGILRSRTEATELVSWKQGTGLRIVVTAQSEACVVFCRSNTDTAETTATKITFYLPCVLIVNYIVLL